ncbi:uncharacterized protein CC84DRAFT_1178140 [Paraphaeosphaeria sporulosa]|uniref:Uncharacterized protein n=1 Tax=Paraphaeosphaeria sporulosa TaxID=1460663 RepID=A0A177C6X6_9PLEO|nr:uncharacterized protein CC84DRAFT_1178140 [Paraphaeosphaeria sporulosa]OAG02497.1 hypothetical protein CC84DRAFT_1178140 [Paraphaeosphaeria sporulosa]
MFTLHSYILPCGHMKYSHICPCQDNFALPTIEDLEVEWNATCISCTDPAIQAEIGRLDKTSPRCSILQPPQQGSPRSMPEVLSCPNEDKYVEQHKIGFGLHEQGPTQNQAGEHTETDMGSLRRQGFDDEWMEWVVECKEAGMDLELLLMRGQDDEATGSEEEDCQSHRC